MRIRRFAEISVLGIFSVFLGATASAQTPYGSFTELEKHEISVGSNLNIRGFCYGGGFLWAMTWEGDLIKIDPSGSIVSTKKILQVGANCSGAICYDNGTLWVIPHFGSILPFDTDGNSLGGGINLYGLPEPFSGEITGVVKDDDGFWLYAFWIPMIFKVDISGNVIKQYPNSWLDRGYSTMAKQGNKIYKMTSNYTPGNSSYSYEALGVDSESGYVTDSWEYPNDSDPIGLSAGDNCFWTLEFDSWEYKIIIRKLSVPNPSPPPGLPSTQWGDFIIKKWGYSPIKPSMIEGLYGFEYDRVNKKIWLGDGIANFYAANDVGSRIFPLSRTWNLGYRIPYDIAVHGDKMWIAQYWLGVTVPAISRIQIVDDSVQVLEEWEVGMGRVTGLATDGTHLWVSGRESPQTTGDPNNDIWKFDLSGNLIAKFHYDENTNYEDLTWHKGGLWAISRPDLGLFTTCKIHDLDPNSGAVLHAYKTGWVVPADNAKGTLASNGDSLLTFAALATGIPDMYQKSHLRLIEIQLPSDQVSDDLLGTWSGQGVYYRNSKTGAWVKMASPATQITAGDIDNDGTDDLIGIWPGQGGVWVKFSGSKSWSRLSSTADWIASGDMNGDGRVDLLGTWAGQGVYYRNSQTGSWMKMANPATQIAAGDLDNDGTDDLIGIWPSQGGIWVKYSKSKGWSKLSSTAHWIDSGDMNGDGRDDLLGTWIGQGVYYRDSQAGSWVKMATPATQIAAGDLDGDGTDDLTGIWPGQGGVWIKYSDDGTWKRLSSTADWIACGRMRGEGGGDIQIVPSGPFGGKSEGPAIYDRHEDLASQGPGGWNFVFKEEVNLIPQGQRKLGIKRIPGPGEPGFKCKEQKNLMPQEQERAVREKRDKAGARESKRNKLK